MQRCQISPLILQRGRSHVDRFWKKVKVFVSFTAAAAAAMDGKWPLYSNALASNSVVVAVDGSSNQIKTRLKLLPSASVPHCTVRHSFPIPLSLHLSDHMSAAAAFEGRLLRHFFLLLQGNILGRRLKKTGKFAGKS